MITRSITTANPSSIIEQKKKKCKIPHNIQKLFFFSNMGASTAMPASGLGGTPRRTMTSIEFLKKNGKGIKQDKLMGCRDTDKSTDISEENQTKRPKLRENDLDCDGAELNGGLEMEVVSALAPASHHKGLARKVLLDVVGLLNLRLWSLWTLSQIFFNFQIFFFLLFLLILNKHEYDFHNSKTIEFVGLIHAR
ncbi:hypothetical protein PVL29_006396 [Vitis rotundifolia]|uniref:Uncharacterized protein n=1 Tax=Vitis rotundifolia TaxID=103349 RepID=A0AA39A557_VITRO|nr:hypothetical protein PVL29_006396 [Vitis rotundifolia]